MWKQQSVVKSARLSSASIRAFVFSCIDRSSNRWLPVYSLHPFDWHTLVAWYVVPVTGKIKSNRKQENILLKSSWNIIPNVKNREKSVLWNQNKLISIYRSTCKCLWQSLFVQIKSKFVKCIEVANIRNEPYIHEKHTQNLKNVKQNPYAIGTTVYGYRVDSADIRSLVSSSGRFFIKEFSRDSPS